MSYVENEPTGVCYFVVQPVKWILLYQPAVYYDRNKYNLTKCINDSRQYNIYFYEFCMIDLLNTDAVTLCNLIFPCMHRWIQGCKSRGGRWGIHSPHPPKIGYIPSPVGNKNLLTNVVKKLTSLLVVKKIYPPFIKKIYPQSPKRSTPPLAVKKCYPLPGCQKFYPLCGY